MTDTAGVPNGSDVLREGVELWRKKHLHLATAFKDAAPILIEWKLIDSTALTRIELFEYNITQYAENARLLVETLDTKAPRHEQSLPDFEVFKSNLYWITTQFSAVNAKLETPDMKAVFQRHPAAARILMAKLRILSEALASSHNH